MIYEAGPFATYDVPALGQRTPISGGGLIKAAGLIITVTDGTFCPREHEDVPAVFVVHESCAKLPRQRISADIIRKEHPQCPVAHVPLVQSAVRSRLRACLGSVARTDYCVQFWTVHHLYSD